MRAQRITSSDKYIVLEKQRHKVEESLNFVRELELQSNQLTDTNFEASKKVLSAID